MSKWTHNICMNCWKNKYGSPHELGNNKPIKLKNANEEICCYCGNKNKDGIFIRDNPNNCKCNHS